jgi:cell division septum initiation protein DivIVA
MSDDQNAGFGKFVPGFDFLQNIAKGASQSIPQMPSLSSWVAPTLNVEELQKRIDELKAVHFWLDQNSKALGATIQALEVQKMTLATLKGMNFSMGEVANALKLKTSDAMFGAAQMMAGGPQETVGQTADVPGPATAQEDKPARKAATRAAGAGVVDPLQWWGALTQQFQQIAAGAMKEATRETAMDAARNMATGMAREAMKTATGMALPAAAKKSGAAAKSKAPTRKAAPRKAPRTSR